MTDNVVPLAVRLTETAPLELRQRRYDECQHEHVTLDEVLRILTCRDCGQERLDAFDHLVHLAHVWARWEREAATLKKLNDEYAANRRAIWERRRDRHLHAHPEHVLDYGKTGWSRGECRECDRIVNDGRRYQPRQARPSA